MTPTTTPSTTASSPPAVDDAMPVAAPRPTVAPLRTTSWIPLFGVGTWIGPLWLVVLVGNAVALGAVVRWGSLDQSLWVQAGAGWQRWPVGVGGFLTASMFVPLFVHHGMTRRRLAESAIVTMVVLATAGAAMITLGFFLEGFVYDAEGWTHAIDKGGRTVDAIGLPMIFVAYLLTLAAWFVGGWLLAIAVARAGWLGAVPGVVVGLLPIAAVEFLVMNQNGSTQFDFLDSLGSPSTWVGITAATVAVVVATAAAARATRSIDVR